MRIVIDAMGGDNAPQAPVQGAIEAVKKYGCDITLVGDSAKIEPLLEGADRSKITVVHTSEVISNEEKATTAIRGKKDSSMSVALKLVADGEGDAIVSAAESLAVGSCRKIAYAHGYCYVYKCETEDYAFIADNYESYFSDFKSNVSDYLFAKDVAVFTGDVVFKERADSIAVTALPYKNLIRVRF